MKNIYHIKVSWGDTDAAGIVFYPNFYKWMDQATHELFHSIGFSVSELFVREKIGMPLLEAHCQFQSPAFFEDQIDVHSEVVELRNKAFQVEHTFKKDLVIASGYELRVWTVLDEGKPKAVPIPEQIRNALKGN